MSAFEVNGMNEFIATVQREEINIAPQLREAVRSTARNVRNTMRADMKSSSSFAKLAPSISDEVQTESDAVVGEIGIPRRNGAGKDLGFGANIAYFGGANGGGGTVRDPIEALDEHTEEFQDALAALMFFGRGL